MRGVGDVGSPVKLPVRGPRSVRGDPREGRPGLERTRASLLRGDSCPDLLDVLDLSDLCLFSGDIPDVSATLRVPVRPTSPDRPPPTLRPETTPWADPRSEW